MPICFDKVASSYLFLEKALFGSSLQQMRCSHLSHIENSKKILLVGEGCGFFLRRLLEVNQEAMITVVEPSERMVQQAKSRVPDHDRQRVFFCKTPLEEFLPQVQFNAACTCFLWDCFEENQIKKLLPKVLDCLESGGFLINVDFAETRSSEGRRFKISHFILLRMLYGFFRFTTGIESTRVTEIKPMAESNGFYVMDSRNHEKLPILSEVFRRKNFEMCP